MPTLKSNNRIAKHFSFIFMLSSVRSCNVANYTIPSLVRCYVAPELPTFLLDEVIHLLLYAVVPVGDVNVEGVVAAGLLICPLPPLVIGLHQAAARLWDHMVH